MPILEINYISPITNQTFPTTNKYYLVILYANLPENIIIHKLPISLDNVTSTTRAYHIHQAIDIVYKTKYTVHIFQLDPKNVLTLLFTNIFDPNSFEYNNIQPITLYPLPLTLGEQKSVKYNNDLSFLSEQFYKYENLLPENQCVLFFTLKVGTYYPFMPKTLIPIKDLPKMASYDKYYIIFTIPVDYNKSKFETTNYVDYVTHYQIDLNKYVPKISSNFKDMLLRKIDLSQRLPTHNLNLNNAITCPTDCSMAKILSKNSFSCTLSPSDYPRMHLPYQGYLLNIKVKYLSNNNFCYILNFTNNYFIPPSVGEREYISVVYGHNVQVSRGYPELVNVQPDTSLYFDIILIGTDDKESILITNEKLQKFIDRKDKRKLWFEQGDELCGFNNCQGQFIMAFNREIKFDIQDKYNNYIKLNDTIGYIQ